MNICCMHYDFHGWVHLLLQISTMAKKNASHNSQDMFTYIYIFIYTHIFWFTYLYTLHTAKRIHCRTNHRI